jgi:hypothetical protein
MKFIVVKLLLSLLVLAGLAAIVYYKVASGTM